MHRDSIRLEWMCAHPEMSIQWRQPKGLWLVMNTSNGLTLQGYGNTAREAIDMAIQNEDNHCYFNHL